MNTLRLALTAKESVIIDLETQVEMAKSSTSSFDSSDLVAACQSDKVAASRAMAQNKQLKEQLEELQTAIVSLVRKKWHHNIKENIDLSHWTYCYRPTARLN